MIGTSRVSAAACCNVTSSSSGGWPLNGAFALRGWFVALAADIVDVDRLAPVDASGAPRVGSPSSAFAFVLRFVRGALVVPCVRDDVDASVRGELVVPRVREDVEMSPRSEPVGDFARGAFIGDLARGPLVVPRVRDVNESVRGACVDDFARSELVDDFGRVTPVADFVRGGLGAAFVCGPPVGDFARVPTFSRGWGRSRRTTTSSP